MKLHQKLGPYHLYYYKRKIRGNLIRYFKTQLLQKYAGKLNDDCYKSVNNMHETVYCLRKLKFTN